MSNLKLRLPQGAYDFLPDECERKTKLEEALREEFKAGGYREIQTSSYEYYDVFTQDAVPYVQENMIKFFDGSGRILVMRPEMTVPIARVASTKLLPSSEPLRLYYLQNVFGIAAQNRGEQTEICQAGVELIGKGGFEGDIEIIALAVKTLQLAQLKNFKIDIGQVSYFRGILEESGIDEVKAEILRGLIDEKNTVELEYVLDDMNVEPSVKKKLLELPGLFGGKEVFEKAYALAENDTCKKAVDNVKRVYDKMCEMGYENYVTVDFGLLNNYKYYSGIIFRGITDAVGSPVLSGGRYDNLLGEFGTPAPATGFAVGIKEILKATRQQETNGEKSDYLTIALAKGRLAKKAKQLFEKCGMDCSALEEDTRKLVLEDEKNKVRFLMVKPADVPVYVYHGVADIGVVGKDTLIEEGLPLYEVLDLKCAVCKICVAGYKDKKTMSNIRKIATKYPQIAKKYYNNNGEDIEIIKLNGSIELAPILGLADVIVDIVESGRTLVENGLSVLDDVYSYISARLVVNRVSMKTKYDKIAPLIEKLKKELEEQK